MKAIKYICLIIVLLYGYSCKEKFPESYGIYTVSESKFYYIEPQKLTFKGNLFSSISGLKEATGINHNSVKELIVFEKDVNPKKIYLTKLRFQEGCEVQDLFDKLYIELKLWTADNNIKIEIVPVDGKNDMYRIIPGSPLVDGFYALHFGELTNKETISSIDQVVYGFVIGSMIKPYESYENKKNETDKLLSENAEKILPQINNLFNNKNYNELRKMYLKPDESQFSDTEWNKQIEGFSNWYIQSGKIISSVITNKLIENNTGTFQLQTNYEKLGIINEELVVVFKDNSYFVTFIGSN